MSCNVLVAFCLCTVGSAGIVTIGFDKLAEGTIVANQYASSDVVVSGGAEVLTAGSLLDDIDFPPHSGTNVIADLNGPIIFSFAQPVWSAGAWFTFTQQLQLEFFSDSGAVLDSSLSSATPNFGPGTNNTFLGFTSSSPSIGSFEIIGAPAGSGPSFTMDDLTITTTPEPASGISLLFGLAFTVAVYYGRKRCRNFVRELLKISPIPCLIVAVCMMCCAQTPGIINSLIPSPGLLTVATGPALPGTVRLVANVALNSKLIATSVELTQVTATGALIQALGEMYDDGTHGDAVAGDNLFTTQISVPLTSPTTLYYRATAAYTGSILRGQSPIASILVANPSYVTSPTAASLKTQNNNTFPVNQALFSVAPGTSAATVQAIAKSVGGTIVGYNSPSNLYQLQVPATTAPQLSAIVSQLQTNPDVTGAAKNYVAVPFGASVVNDLTHLAASMPSACSTPHNPSCPTAAYDQVSTIPAYQFLADVNPTYSRTVIGVIDSGVDASLPKFAGVNFGSSATDQPLTNLLGNGIVNNLTDSTGHGTADVGIIGANCTICATGGYIFPQMNGILSGIPPAVPPGIPGDSVVPYVIEIRNWGMGTFAEVNFVLTDLFGRIEPADAHGNPPQTMDVLLLPFGWYEQTPSGPCPPLSCILASEFASLTSTMAAEFAALPGITVVVAAGDAAQNAANTLPGATSPLANNVITVAATDLNDNLATWSGVGAPGPGSNWGSAVDIAAPGSSVYVPTLSGGYNSSFEGTSASAAFVAGTAGLVHSIYGVSALTGSQTIGLLQFGADTIPNPSTAPTSGLRLNTNLSVGGFLIDLFFLIDTTGSMSPSISGVNKTVENYIVNPLRTMGLNVDFGVAQFKDYGDVFVYDRVADIATVNPFWTKLNEAAMFNAIDLFTASGGGDTPEAQLVALNQMATGLGQDTANPTAFDYVAPNQQANWRTCPTTPAPATCQDLRIAVLITDASFHTGGPYPNIASTISALNAKNIKVIGIQPDDYPSEVSDQQTAIAQFNMIASGTGSMAPANLSTPYSCGTTSTVSPRQPTSVSAGQPLVCTVNNNGTGLTTFVTNAILGLARQLH